MIEPVTHCTQSLPQSFALLLPNRFVAAFIGEQGLFKLRQNVVGNVNVLKDLSQPGGDLFLAEVGQLAFATKSGAMVVGIAVFLDFRCHHAIVIGAAEQTGKGKVMLSVLHSVASAKDSLHLFEEFGADKRRLRTAVELVFPHELPFVEGIHQQALQIAFGEPNAKLRFQNAPHAIERVLA
ncbi:MAG: hypothetical protein WB716_03645 [Candidatus Acidiferrales bacterium]